MFQSKNHKHTHVMNETFYANAFSFLFCFVCFVCHYYFHHLPNDINKQRIKTKREAKYYKMLCGICYYNIYCSSNRRAWEFCSLSFFFPNRTYSKILIFIQIDNFMCFIFFVKFFYISHCSSERNLKEFIWSIVF